MDGCDTGISILESVGVFCCSRMANVVGLRRKPFLSHPFFSCPTSTLFLTVRKCPMGFGCLEWFCFFLSFFFLSLPLVFYFLVLAKLRDGVGWHKIGRGVSSGGM